jgi:hypothetical protein
MTIRTLGFSMLVALTMIAGCAAQGADDSEASDDALRRGDVGELTPIVETVIPGGGNPCPECRFEYRTSQSSTPTSSTALSSYQLSLRIPESLRRYTRAELRWQPAAGGTFTTIGPVYFTESATSEVLGYPYAPAISSTSTARAPGQVNYFIDFVCVEESADLCPRAELEQRRYRAYLSETWLSGFIWSGIIGF